MRAISIVTIRVLLLGLVIATAPANASAQEERPPFTRLRFGAGGAGGWHVAGGPDIGMGGGQLRVGAQVGQHFAAYYMASGFVGAITDRPGSGRSTAGMFWNTAMAELTPTDFMQIAGGPSADWIWGCDDTFQNEVDCDSTEAFFGMHARLAFALGGYGPGPRSGLTISADVHSTWYRSDDPSVSIIGGIGFDLF